MPPLDIPGLGPGGPAPGGEPPAGPAAAPMSSPTEQEGLKAQARQGIQLAIKLLEASLLPFGTTSPEGKKILSSINSLTKLGGESGGPDLNQAEVKMLAAKAGPTGAGPGGPPPGAGGPPPGGMPMMGPGPRPL
jgi:hypothetical protein